MEERTGEAYELGEQLTVAGTKLHPGAAAPAFALDSFDGEVMQTVRLADSAGSVRLLNVVNSLDTPVCHVETHRWETMRGDLPENVQVYTISMDLPFGRDYGVLIKEWRLLQRAVFVIDASDHIAYAEYVGDQMHEPDYAAAIAAARRTAG